MLAITLGLLTVLRKQLDQLLRLPPTQFKQCQSGLDIHSEGWIRPLVEETLAFKASFQEPSEEDNKDFKQEDNKPCQFLDDMLDIYLGISNWAMEENYKVENMGLEEFDAFFF